MAASGFRYIMYHVLITLPDPCLVIYYAFTDITMFLSLLGLYISNIAKRSSNIVVIYQRTGLTSNTGNY